MYTSFYRHLGYRSTRIKNWQGGRIRNNIPALIALVWALIALNQQYKYDDQIRAIKKERDELICNTASFKKYSNAYKEELKAGKMPFEGYSSSISDIIDSLDKKEQQFREAYPRAKRSINTRQHEYLEK